MDIDLKDLKEFVKRELNSPRSPINKGLVLEVLPAGSFLYGLMTEKSDIDLIAITLPSFSDVLFTKRSIEKTTDFEYKGHRLEINVISITDFFSYIVGGRPPMFIEAIIECCKNAFHLLHRRTNRNRSEAPHLSLSIDRCRQALQINLSNRESRFGSHYS